MLFPFFFALSLPGIFCSRNQIKPLSECTRARPLASGKGRSSVRVPFVVFFNHDNTMSVVSMHFYYIAFIFSASMFAYLMTILDINSLG